MPRERKEEVKAKKRIGLYVVGPRLFPFDPHLYYSVEEEKSSLVIVLKFECTIKESVRGMAL